MNGSIRKTSTVLLGGLLTLVMVLCSSPIHTAAAAGPVSEIDIVIDPTQSGPPDRPPLPSEGSGGRDSKGRKGDPALFGDVPAVEARVGDTVIIPLKLVNYIGRSDDVVVVSELPPFLQIDRATTSWGELEVEGNTVVVDIGKLFKDDVVEINIVVNVVQAVASPENLVVANVSTTSSNDDPENNTAVVQVDVRLSGAPVTPPPEAGAPPPAAQPGQGSEIVLVEGQEGVAANMALNSRPAANVTIEFLTDEQLNPIPPVTFTPDNWNDIQVVFISAREDFVAEGVHTSVINFNVFSEDPVYNGVQLPGLVVTIEDNDQPGIIITL